MTPDPAPTGSSRPLLVLGAGADETTIFESITDEALAALRSAGEKTIFVAPDALSGRSADHLYHLPLDVHFLERVIATEKPRAIVFSAAGASAHTAGLALDSENILRRYGVEVLGTPLSQLHDLAERPLGLLELPPGETEVRKSISCRSLDEALRAAEFLGYPVSVRGHGRQYAAPDIQSLKEHVRHVLLHEENVLIEEDVSGAQSVSVLVFSDCAGDLLAVADAEAIDPLSANETKPMLVAPSQTLTPETQKRLWRTAEHIAKHLGIVGVATVTFSIDRRRAHERAVSIEAGVRRQGALIARLWDLPLGRLHTELLLGRGIQQLFPRSPTVHGVAVALPPTQRRVRSHALMPAFAGETLSGDAMGLGKTIGEALQSAMRALNIGGDGLETKSLSPADMRRHLKQQGPVRLLAAAAAFGDDWGLNQIHAATGIDLLFLQAIERTAALRREVFQGASDPLSVDLVWALKRDGFSDRAIARIRGQSATEVTAFRHREGILPSLHWHRSDHHEENRSAYLGYHQSDSPTPPRSDLLFPVLGPTASPSGRAADWCAAEALQEIATRGYRGIVMTGDPWAGGDARTCRIRLAADLSAENLSEARRLLEPSGMTAWYAGERAYALWPAIAGGALGTDADRAAAIDDPRRLASICADLGVAAPDWREVADAESALASAELLGYPLFLRGSRGLTGGRTLVARTPEALRSWFEGRDSVGRDAHVTIAAALGDELVEVDAVAQQGDLRTFSVRECLERFGGEDGEDVAVVPAQRLSLQELRALRIMTSALCRALQVSGPLTVQFLLGPQGPQVIGAAAQFGTQAPLTRLATGENLAREAIMAGLGLLPGDAHLCDGDCVAVRLSQPRPGGRAAALSLAPSVPKALLLSFLSLGHTPPERRLLLCIDDLEDLTRLLPTIQLLQRQGAVLLATTNAHEFLLSRSVPTGLLHRPSEPRSPNVREYLEQGRLDLVVSIPPTGNAALLEESRLIEDLATQNRVSFVGNAHVLTALASALADEPPENLPCQPEVGWGRK